MQIQNHLQDQGLFSAVVIAHNVTIAPASPELQLALDELIASRQGEEFPPPNVKDAVRNLLRSSAFKPTGRNKPASEYLGQAAREGRFPRINNLVDINNYVSLRSGLPISLLDADVIGDTLELRKGKEGERYVFNSAGQEIELNGLICACSAATSMPLGNPIKDSIAGKIKERTLNVAGIIYAPRNAEMMELATEHAKIFADLLRQEGRSTDIRVRYT